MGKVYIYGLAEPDTGAIRYVGKTVDPASRLSAHKSIEGSRAKRIWLRHLQDKGLEPEMQMLEVLEDDERWREREIYWLKKIIDGGIKVVNGWADINAATGTFCDEKFLWEGARWSFDDLFLRVSWQQAWMPPVKETVSEQMSFDLSSADTAPAWKSRHKLSLLAATCIYKERERKGTSYKRLGDKYGISESMAYRICSGERWPKASLEVNTQ